MNDNEDLSYCDIHSKFYETDKHCAECKIAELAKCVEHDGCPYI